MANENDYNYRRTSNTGSRPVSQGSHSSALAKERESAQRSTSSGASSGSGTIRSTSSGTARTGGYGTAGRSSGANARNDRNKYMIRRIVFALVVLAVIALLIFAIVKIAKAVSGQKKNVEDVVMSEVSFEAGEYGPAAEQLLTETGRTAVLEGARIEYETDIGQINFHVLGTYKIILIFTDTEGNKDRHTVKINVVDTVPPKGVAKDVFTVKGHPLSVGDFIVPGSVDDATDVAVSLLTEPDYNKAGTQTVDILLEDRGGNKTRLTASLTVTED
ncbi:MAG: hypothetical protein J5950_09225 [Clostridia bacterium]|nr:hypothetical protein [Clostridia bacterium]